ncbi:MAG: hypothetical protein Unbinned664contig1000_59 [Prokaryotic dsDNA virus sp.]|nr:MAG: hypothetical protein Unbinned664contig1000_59 [Prokaryotic dsDNA virus sp.]|tara:strand:- start:12378 stop:12611 length:234 start_codon:yes stop_codon:yes gene_type:complete
MAEERPLGTATWPDVGLRALDLFDQHQYLICGTLLVLVLIVVLAVPATTRALANEVMQGLDNIIRNKAPADDMEDES